MSLAQWWSFGMVAYGVAGLYLAGNKRVLGWWIGLSAQVLWVGFAFVTGLWPFYLSALAYGWVNVRNLLRWRHEALQSATKQDHSFPRSPAGDKSQYGESSQDIT